MISVQPIQKVFRPFQRFLRLQSSSSILLLAALILALAWANSPWYHSYHDFWHAPVKIEIGSFSFIRSLHFWINDALMTIFFLVVGLEIKRELIVGELSTPKQAILPIAAAIGGILVPAGLFFLINPPDSPYASAWGIPVVTDIAFAIGVLTVLGSRVPLGLKVFLTALAIVDDLAAIVLIAVFYSSGFQWMFLLLALVICLILILLNRLKVDSPIPYLLFGVVLWVVVLQTGLHPTIAGVILALTIPARGKINPARFYENASQALNRFRKIGIPEDKRTILTNEEHQASVQQLESLCEGVQAPLQQVEHALHPWSSFVILPLFALANAGVHVELDMLGQSLTHPLTSGIIAGLVLGKQLGITLFAWLAVKFGVAQLPKEVRWSGIYGTATLGGIGFTMSLFISVLAFTDAATIDTAKIGILIASLASAIWGALVLHVQLKKAT